MLSKSQTVPFTLCFHQWTDLQPYIVQGAWRWDNANLSPFWIILKLKIKNVYYIFPFYLDVMLNWQ